MIVRIWNAASRPGLAMAASRLSPHTFVQLDEMGLTGRAYRMGDEAYPGRGGDVDVQLSYNPASDPWLGAYDRTLDARLTDSELAVRLAGAVP